MTPLRRLADDFLVFYLFLLVDSVHRSFTQSHVDRTRFLRTDTSRSFTKFGSPSLSGGRALLMRWVLPLDGYPFCLTHAVVRDDRCTEFHLPHPLHHNLDIVPSPFRCSRTAWIEIAIFVFLTFLAQIFLTVRSVDILHGCLTIYCPALINPLSGYTL